MDILLLVFFCWKIKNIVKPKGYNGRTWIIYMILACVLAEFGGFFVSFLLGKDMNTMMITGILCAVTSFLVMQQRAKALPDKSGNDDWMSKLGNNQDYMS